MKICGITTKAGTAKSFMLGNLSYMVQHGHRAYCICQKDEMLQKIADENNVIYYPVDIKWGNVTPVELYKNIRELYLFFKREKIEVIQYATSNASLCASIAGLLARVPVRIYCQWGISYTDFSGIKYVFYKFMEAFTCFLSTSVQPDSNSNLTFAISEKLYRSSKGYVLFNGSACGGKTARA